MSENIAQVHASRRKKVSLAMFEYTSKEYFVKSKENPNGLHKAAAAWLDVLKEAGRPMTRDECLAALAGRDTGTTQPAIRIVYYWKRSLLDGGYIKIFKKGETAVEASATDAVPAPTVS